jgi:excisionase family DNA binding protein
MHRILSPKQAALALGSSESTLKRWCDQGVLRSDKTPGGHRRIRVADLVNFARAQHLELVTPEAIGLPRSVVTATGLDHLREQLECALLEDDPPRVTSLLVHGFVGGRPMSELGDQLIAPVMARIGEHWHLGRIAIYQEHRATQILLRALTTLDDLLVPPSDCAPMALGASPSGDQSTVAATLVALTLRELGWNACYIGPDSPTATLVQAVADRKPSLFWMSVTHLANEAAFARGFRDLAAQCHAHNIPIVMGGRALNASVRKRLSAPLDTPARGKPLDTLARGKPLDTPARGKPLDTPARGKPLDTPARGKPLDPLARGKPLAGPIYCDSLAQFASIARAIHSRTRPYAGGST